MKVALLSDIHGNGYALEAVLKAAKDAGVERYLIAGDFIGHYYNIDKILKMLSEIDYVAVRGNHEDMYRDVWAQSSDDIKSRYGQSFKTCDEHDIDHIINLPERQELDVDGKSVLMCHGTPWNHDQYMYPDAPEEMTNRAFAYQKDIVVFGHTHYQVKWEQGTQVVVNPGSVGQPRDYKPGACWALWDTDTHKVELFREAYNIQTVIDECRQFDPDLQSIQDVLLRERAA